MDATVQLCRTGYDPALGWLSTSSTKPVVSNRSSANSTLRMCTVKNYDYPNRLQSIASHPGGTPSLASPSYTYQYKDANRRVRMTLADGSYWLYEYDALGQVKTGKRYWSDNAPVTGLWKTIWDKHYAPESDATEDKFPVVGHKSS